MAAVPSIFVTITGQQQGKFKGEGSSKAQPGKIPAIGFHYAVARPQDMKSAPSGGVQHTPVCITKSLGAASPQCFKALITNESLIVVIEFLTTTPDGKEEVAYSIKLANAVIIKLEQTWSAQGISEEVCMKFQSIEVASAPGGTSATDNW